MNITVVKHKAGVTTKLPGAFYIGRTLRVRKQYIPGATWLANPYVVGKDGDRAEVIRRFRQLLWKGITVGGPMLTDLLDILDRAKQGEVNLCCHCKPLACHGDVIKAAVEWLASVTEQPDVEMVVEELGAKILSMG